MTVRNVIIHHSASGMGLFAWKTDDVTIENVEIESYGNSYGANPCPTGKPMEGWRCQNILCFDCPRARINNVRLTGGGDGLRLRGGVDAHVSRINVRNVRGPYPSGLAMSLVKSDNILVEDFDVKNDQSAWTGDQINFFASNNIHLRRGTVDGNNNP